MRTDGWKEARLGDHVDIQTGFPFKSKEYTEDPTGTPLLRGDNIVQGKLRWESVKRWPANDATNRDRYFLCEDDVVLAMDRPWIEAGLKYAWMSKRDLPCLLVQRVSRLRGINGLSTQFARYVIGHHSFTDYVKGIWTGVAVPHISESQIRAFRFHLPPPHVQTRISEVLSAYDDSIENNTRRIKILEQMAQMLYREWFVDFRFPGHEKVKMVKSEIGLIPKGWEVDPLRFVASFIGRGISPTYDDSAEGRVINQKCIRDGKLLLRQVRRQSKKAPQEKMVRMGDVLINSTGVGTLGRVAQVLGPVPNCTVDSHVSIVRPNRHPEFLGRALLELEDFFAAQGVGSTGQTELGRERIGATLIVMPPENIQEAFCRVVSPMNSMLLCCLKKNEVLQMTRDLLLPKLLSGEISVKQIKQEVVARMV